MPSKPRSCLKWPPTGRIFDLKGKIIASSESECYPNLFMVRRLGLFQAYDQNLKLLINFVWKFLGTVRFGNDHIAAILGYNLFSVGQFCDLDLEVAFKRNTCFVRNLEGVDLLKGNCTTNLYTINLHEMASASPICLMARATSTKSKDETPEVIKTFLKRITILLQSPVIIIRTDNGTEFKNQILKEYFDSVGISHQTSSVRTPQQKGVVERRNQTLVEATRTMLIFSRAPKPDISFLHVFGALCYPKNDREDIRKLAAKGLDLTNAPSTITTQQPTEGELDLMFEAMYDDYIGGQPSTALRTTLAAQAPLDVDELETQQQHVQHQENQAPLQPKIVADNVPNAMFDENTFVNPFATPSTSAAESSFS
ncbi:retrovirus-related pol polyprotein from transposon TNT 1-94 [Tanacetum coccineum]|uniref:Retrovirus-related pol polyprotein from transposon TNT 1-94 n=1 Tax=Tanacetum coccineum TaxID=301880 RepID=A0ABQ4XGX6_9ASTR